MRIHLPGPFIQAFGFLATVAIASALGCTSGGSTTDNASTAPPPPPAATMSPPVLSPSPGYYSDSVSISISSTAPGAQIFYTRDGTIPTSASTLYADPLIATPQSVDMSERTEWVIQAIAMEGGMKSAVTRGVYSMSYSQDPKPVFSPSPGKYASPQLVAITSFAASAVIYYTLDGSEPSYVAGGSTYRYVAPIPIDKTTTIKAWALAYHSATPVVTATYTY